MSAEEPQRRANFVSDFFREQAKSYSENTGASFYWHYIEKPAFDKHLQDLYKVDTRALDAGCGSGKTIQHLIDRGIDPSNIVGIDLSLDMLKIGRKKSPGVKLVQSDLADVSLSDGRFDLVTCSMVFHYLDEDGLQNALGGFHRLLKDGGVLFYVVTHPVRIVSKNLAEYQNSGWRTERTPWGADAPFFHRRTADILNATLRAGFAIEVVDEPPVSKEGEWVDPEEYQKYCSYGASRLVVRARKNS